ncbi:MAG: hypothetical protein FJ290_30835 [Planctomycetes bacterium]|nr:hypothetical protein [Planctomycetota bacterium]
MNRLCVALSILCSMAWAGEEWPSPVTWQPDKRAVESGLYIAPRPLATKAQVAFTVTEPSGVARRRWPVRGAIPLFRGELRDPNAIRLLNAAGKEIPVQGLATAFWPEKTIRFLCLDFLTDLGPNEEKRFTLEYGTEFAGRKGELYTVTSEDLWQGRGRMPGFRGKAVVCSNNKGEDPKEHPIILEHIRMVEQGPVQATFHLLGHYGEEKAFQPADPTDRDAWRYPVSLFFRVYGGTSIVHIEHTFGYNGDEYHDFVQSYGLTFQHPKATRFLYGKDGGEAAEAPLGVRLNQFAHDKWELTGKATASGKRFGGWAAVQSKDTWTLVAVRDGWQNWPVAFRAEENGDLTVEMLGEKPGRALDLRYEEEGGEPLRKIANHSMFFGDELTFYYSANDRGTMRGRARGIKKIHELLLDFSPVGGGSVPREGDKEKTRGTEAPPTLADVGKAFQLPLAPWPGAERFKETRALGHIGVYGEPKWDFLKDYFSVMFDGLTMTHEANGLYGWVDWGDLPMCNTPSGGKFKMEMDGGVGWSNGERAMAPYLYHYAAGGGRRFLDLGRAMVHHTIGIDTEHPGGDMKHGAYHRHNQVHWRHNDAGTRQGGYRGWHNYYWLTGDPEVGRLMLLEGLDSPAQRTMMDLRAENKDVRVGYDYQHCASHLLAHLCWITSGDWRYARAHPAIVKLWKIAGDEGKATQEGWVFFSLKDGEPAGYKLAKPGPQLGYWLTYGGDDLCLEWAALTGDPNAVDAILLQGKFHGKGSIPNGPEALYHSPEALYLGLAYLDPGHPELKRLLQQRLWANTNLKRLRDQKLTTTGAYKSAEDWDRYGTYLYRKNGFSIHGAQGLEVLHLMRAMELLKMEP